MKHSLSIFFLIVLICSAHAVEFPRGQLKLIDLPITARVDTTNAEVKEVYQLVRKFFSDRPDSNFNNSYWNEDEKEKYAEPYPAREIIYKDKFTISSYPPKVLSIDREGDYYCAKILYYSEGLKEPYRSSNPWAIQRLYARKIKIKEKKNESDSLKSSEVKTANDNDNDEENKDKKKDNKEFRLFDPLQVITDNWRHDRIGPIDYYYPQDFYLSRKPARSMVLFCKNLRGKYKLEDVEPISF